MANTKNLNVEISAKILEAVKRKAKASGMKLYAYVEVVLAAHLAQPGPGK